MFRPARLLVALLLFLCGLCEAAQATPFFARAYGFKCQTCHSGFPRLNAFGLAFKANNFRLPGAERSAPMMWQKTIPLAVQVKPETINSSPGGVNQLTDTQLLAGGLLSRTTAVYLHHTYFLDATPTPFPSYELWVQQVLNDRSKIMLKAGQFELPFAYSFEINRTTISLPLLLFLGTLQPQDVALGGNLSGLQMSGTTGKDLRWYLAGGAPAQGASGNLVGDRTFFGRFRDVFARLAVGQPDRHIGLFAQFTHPPRNALDPNSEDRGTRYGLDGIWTWRGFQFQGMAAYGENSDPQGAHMKGTLRGAFLEADRMIKPWIGLTARLDVLDTVTGGARTYSDAKTISLRLYPYEKVKFTAEYQKLDHGASAVAFGADISF